MILDCKADGNPKPNITWTRRSDNVVVTMPLTSIRRQDARGYRCTADNGVGSSATGDVFVNVKCECCQVIEDGMKCPLKPIRSLSLSFAFGLNFTSLLGLLVVSPADADAPVVAIRRYPDFCPNTSFVTGTKLLPNHKSTWTGKEGCFAFIPCFNRS